MSLPAEISPFKTLDRYRSRLARRIRVKLNTANEVIWHSCRATDHRKVIVLKGEIDQIGAGHTDAQKVRGGRGIALAVVPPQRNELARLPKSEGRPKQLVGRIHYVLWAYSHVVTLLSLRYSTTTGLVWDQDQRNGRSPRSPREPHA